MILIDLHSYEGMLFQMIGFIGYLWLAMFTHEIGHLWALRSRGHKNAVITWDGKDFRAGQEYMYNGKGYKMIYLAGIMVGLPVIFLFSIMAIWPLTIILLLLYGVGCWHDVQQLIR